MKWEAVKLKGRDSDSEEGVWTIRWHDPIASTDPDTGETEEDTYIVLRHFQFLVSFRAFEVANTLNREWLTPNNLNVLPEPFCERVFWHKDNFEEVIA